VVFYDDVDLLLCGEGGKSSEAFDAVGGFCIIVYPFAVGVDADRVAAEELRGLDPS